MSITSEESLTELQGSREAMQPLYDRLLAPVFTSSADAIEFCRELCAEFGFTVKQEASANKHIYVYCSREGIAESARQNKQQHYQTQQRKRPSKRCDCRWRVVLTEIDTGGWQFRQSSNPAAAEHNHSMMRADELQSAKGWRAEVHDFIANLATRQPEWSTSAIRDAVRQQYPHLVWNERRFYNRLTDERKRTRRQAVVDRVQRLLMLSSQLCAIVAANESWATSVQFDMSRMIDTYRQRLAFEDADDEDFVVDLDPQAIVQEQNTRKKKKLQHEQHIIVPSYTLHIPWSKKRKHSGPGPSVMPNQPLGAPPSPPVPTHWLTAQSSMMAPPPPQPQSLPQQQEPLQHHQAPPGSLPAQQPQNKQQDMMAYQHMQYLDPNVFPPPNMMPYNMQDMYGFERQRHQQRPPPP
ncbi:hypothetical protein BCR43DRAFT_504614 [Syncephalastrum racemosum]|uniref:FAR1 domain-containing protein n=1 Tax=Syncephalastrum racemosum TaxID=13706 RepID=A0A1X2HFN6_SYNRA|nr:hypothetical protein BCR43DRAFT_504614 [Syncephalastrum racemosum]